jgi:UrcA family protein
MTSLINKTATVALYALAALPLIAVSMARAEPATIKVSDLSNMSQPAQVQQFNARVDRAAEQVCANYAERREMNLTAACTSAVRAEAADKLAERDHPTISVASR